MNNNSVPFASADILARLLDEQLTTARAPQRHIEQRNAPVATTRRFERPAVTNHNQREVESSSFQRPLLMLASAADRVLTHQLNVCQLRLNELIDVRQNGSDGLNVVADEGGVEGEAIDGATEGTDGTETRIADIYRRTTVLSNDRDLIGRFIRNFDETARDRDALRRLFTIIRHTFEFDLNHPTHNHNRQMTNPNQFFHRNWQDYREPRGLRGSTAWSLYYDSQDHDESREQSGMASLMETMMTAPMPRGGGISSLLAAMMGASTGDNNNLSVERFDLNGGGGDPTRLRDLLRQMGAPANFWDDIPVPMTSEALERIPSQIYSDVVRERQQKEKESNEDCNICLETFKDDDMVRIFPCCELAQHTDCLKKWFETHDNCIVCRKKMSDTE